MGLSPSRADLGQGVSALSQAGNPGIPYRECPFLGCGELGGSLFGFIQNKREHWNRESWDSHRNGEG